MGAHHTFDLVAYRDGEFRRIQVKYRSGGSGAMEVRFTTGWADRHGVHKKPMDKDEVDLVCIYCPETDQCYYLDPAQHRVSVTLRLTPTRNNQVVGVLNAEDYLEMPTC